jgi:hypothetical protein
VASEEAVSEEIEFKRIYQPHFTVKEVTEGRDPLNRSWLAEKNRFWTDQLAVLKELEKGRDIDSTMSGYKAHTLISNAPAMIETFLDYGNIKMAENWMRVQQEGKGIATLIGELGERATPFFERMTAKSGQELIDHFGRQNLWGSDAAGNQIDDQAKIDEVMADTQALYEANQEQWDAIELRLREINGQVLDFMKDTGLISEEQRSKMRQTYIPFYRQIEDVYGEEIETLLPHAGKAIGTTHTLKGSEIHEIGDPMANLISGYSFFINEGLRNLARKKSLKLAKELELIQRVHRGQKGGKNVIQIRHEGEAIHYKVLDPVLFETLTTFQQNKIDMGKWFRAPKKLLTWGVTVMPRFRAFNILRDTLSAAFMQKGFIPFVDTYQGLVHVMRKSPEWVEWTSTGGNFQGSYSKRDISASTAKGVERLKKKLTRQKSNGVVEFARGMAGLWERIGDMSESANRMGIFLRQKQRGESVTQAAVDSRDLLDFHRKGAGTAAQMLIQTVPFLNARIQGLSKMARSAKNPGARKRFWFAASAMTLASLALHYYNEDNEDYQNLSDWEKIAYWHFYIGGEHYRVPTPFEVGSLFGALPVAIAESVKGDRSLLELGTFTWQVISNALAFNPLPQLFRPIIEQVANFDFFRMQPIESVRDKNLEVTMRANKKSSHFAKQFSRLMDKADPFDVVSPKRIDKLIRDYMGGSADLVTGMLDAALMHLDPAVDPAGTYLDKVLRVAGVEGFAPDAFQQGGKKVPTYTKYTSKYYDMMRNATIAYNTMRVHNKTEGLSEKEYVELEIERELKLDLYDILISE